MIPNHMATANAVTNHCSPPGPKRLSFNIPIDYRVPAPRAHALLTGEAFKAVWKHPKLARSPEPSVVIERLTSDATVFEIRFYADPELIEPDEAITVVGTAVHDAVIRNDMPTPVTQIEINPIPTAEILLGTSEGRKALKMVPLFAAVLSEKQFDTLNEDCRLIDLPMGKPFIKQGDSAASMYVLLEGAAAVSVTNPRGEEHEVALLAAGDFVGEMSLMTGAPRTASVTPLTQLRVLEITKEAMEDLLRDSPELLEHFSRVMAQRQFELQDIASRQADIETAQVDLLTRMTAFFARVFRT
jgi:CRP-like cAMP-binding protein